MTALTQATYLGGTGEDRALAVAFHPANSDVYVAGRTFSAAFPGTDRGAQPSIGGGSDAFVARLTFSLALPDPTPAVPTLSEIAWLALVTPLLGTGVLALRRRRGTR